MRVAVATDHGGFALKQTVIDEVARLGHTVVDLGADDATPSDFPDFAKLGGEALQDGRADRAILLCGSGIGICIAANKMRGVRASVAHDVYSAHQGVEHDSMNALCLGARVIGVEPAREIVRAFLGAEFQTEERFIRRLDKINALEAAEIS